MKWRGATGAPRRYTTAADRPDEGTSSRTAWKMTSTRPQCQDGRASRTSSSAAPPSPTFSTTAVVGLLCPSRPRLCRPSWGREPLGFRRPRPYLANMSVSCISPRPSSTTISAAFTTSPLPTKRMSPPTPQVRAHHFYVM